jgi:riboflavin kinase/FMN adenylyltransferase
MRVFYGLDQFQGVERPVFTTGTFDGVHVGHKKIIAQLNKKAQEIGGESVLFTFYPHPRMVIFPDQNDLKLLLTQDEKIKQLQDAGLQNLIIHPFTKEFSKLSAFEYTRDILVNTINVDTVVVGYDHRFGKNREGDFQLLSEHAEIFGFQIEEIEAIDIESTNVSSTKIRQALEDGNIDRANTYLTYPFILGGRVVHGKKLGTKLQFPTANLEINDVHKILPKNGVYIISGRINDGKELQGMMNIGVRPTVGSNLKRSVEVHFFGIDEELYGEYVEVSLLSRLRDEKKFDGIDELKNQLSSDKKSAMLFFEK